MAHRTPQQILSLFEQTPERTAQNVLGAVRIGGQQQVITLGKGGGLIESPGQLLKAGFREDEVQQITAEEASQLGISSEFTGITAPAGVKPPTPTAPDQPKGEFIQVAGTTQKFQKLPGGGLRGFGTEEEFEKAGGVFGQETPVSGTEFRTIAEAAGVSQKDITSIVGEEATDTAQDIQKVTGRKSALESLLEDEQALNDALGIPGEEKDVEEARQDITDFFTKRKSFETLLKEEFTRRGIETSTTLLNDLNKRILDQQKTLRDLPEDIQRSLEDVGVTQSQLNRAVAKETQGPLEVLRDLLEERGVLSSEINTAMNFAQAFANTRFEDSAVQLSILEFNLESEKGDLVDLEDEKKRLLKVIVDEQKEILSLALDNPSANIDISEDDLQEALDKVAAIPIDTQLTEEIVGGFRILRDASGKVISTRSVTDGRGGGGGFVDDKGEPVSSFEAARVDATGNPDLTDAELKAALLEKYTGAGVPTKQRLTISQINSIVETREQPQKRQQDIEKTIVGAVFRLQDLGFERGEAESRLKAQIKSSLGLKKGDSIPKNFDKFIKKAIRDIYGETFFQKVIPFF